MGSRRPYSLLALPQCMGCFTSAHVRPSLAAAIACVYTEYILIVGAEYRYVRADADSYSDLSGACIWVGLAERPQRRRRWSLVWSWSGGRQCSSAVQRLGPLSLGWRRAAALCSCVARRASALRARSAAAELLRGCVLHVCASAAGRGAPGPGARPARHWGRCFMAARRERARARATQRERRTRKTRERRR